jgi:hypothetical protein
MSSTETEFIEQLNKSRADIRRTLMAAPSTPSEAINQWLADHPIKLASEVLGEATKSIVSPIAQRSPFLFVASAAVVGGLLVWSRPWSWLIKPAVLAGIVPQIISKALAYAPKRGY